MPDRVNTDDFRRLFLEDIPLLDVRAPVEFAQGAFPLARNEPLMNDEERHQVGIRYKEAGQDSAITLGHALVRDEIKAERVSRWCGFAKQHPQGYLYCFRGGLRSRIAQSWIAEAGIDYPLVIGGYKALRRFLIDTLESEIGRQSLVLVSGRTGSGKTRLLNALPKFVDLEGLARHRGSSFGQTLNPQPSQIDFENALAIELLKNAQRPGALYVEDESRLVGRCALPLSLREKMARAPMIVLERNLEERTQVILEDYVIDMAAGFQERDGREQGFGHFSQFLRDSLGRLRRRLGGERHQRLDAVMSRALEAQYATGDLEGHRIWIRELLTDYYDPMYDYQLAKREGQVLQRGSIDQLQRWAKQADTGSLAYESGVV